MSRSVVFHDKRGDRYRFRSDLVALSANARRAAAERRDVIGEQAD
jgi:hypothetical protein